VLPGLEPSEDQRDQTVSFNDVEDQREVFNDLNDRPLTIRISLLDAVQDAILPVPESMTFTVDRVSLVLQTHVRLPGVPEETPTGLVQAIGGQTALHLNSGETCDSEPYAKAFAILANTLYLGAFRNALNVGSGQQYYDLAVGTEFIATWDSFKSSAQNKANRRAAARVQTQLGQIFGLDDVELNASTDNSTLLVRIGDESYRLDEQGAGFAQFLIVLAYVATREPALILIDEPEINLHPALQIDFLNTLTALAPFGVMFATHSIGLARAASDRVYSVRRIGQGESEVRDLQGTPRPSEFLGELSLSGYQELGFSLVLLVEGPSELRTIQRLLRLYRIEHKIVLLPLGGGSMIKSGVETDLEEIKRLTPSVFALVDSERDSMDAPLGNDREGFALACANAGVSCHVLERRALENYFPDRAVKLAKGSDYSALGPYDLLKRSEMPWNKTNDNWRIASEMTRADLDGTDLGAFLQQLEQTVSA
jgi:predicted ATPase